ncbi:class I SAM-dependent methyltransferase [Nocardia blacklockiae]|uniref:class I SAM-dependent methyltransferase n=1 Tax=Nocardia blacklockiae TaxID=480036 RepID=UPI0018954D78|nr:methyltransferase domain-containing protein [Nocardia blacklockiae]MBF6176288.1 transferase [Nocardia blacklockiae]
MTAPGCRACGAPDPATVLDLGKMPAANHFPAVDDPVAADRTHALAMRLCGACGLAQLADDDTPAAEPRGLEPQALRDQAAAAVAAVANDGWLPGDSVREFGSPHGGTWLPLLAVRGFTQTYSRPADVVLDSFGLMHEPDQRAAIADRAAATRRTGVLLVQFHSLHTIVRQRQWNALRHGHFAYYSLTALRALLHTAGLYPATAWQFDLYGGTVLCAAVPRPVEPDESVRRILAAEAAAHLTDAAALSPLQHAADEQVRDLREWLEREAAQGNRVYAYGAASRAVALFARAGLHRGHLAGVADASPAKHGRRMPGTDIPIITPEELSGARPDRVLLTLPDLLPEVRERLPALDRAWVTDIPPPP